MSPDPEAVRSPSATPSSDAPDAPGATPPTADGGAPTARPDGAKPADPTGHYGPGYGDPETPTAPPSADDPTAR